MEVEIRKVMLREINQGQIVFVNLPVPIADMADKLWNLGCELQIEAEPNHYNVSVRDNDEAKAVMIVSQISAIDNLALGRIGKVIGEAYMHKFGGKVCTLCGGKGKVLVLDLPCEGCNGTGHTWSNK
jgi:hypothetical protein